MTEAAKPRRLYRSKHLRRGMLGFAALLSTVLPHPGWAQAPAAPSARGAHGGDAKAPASVVKAILAVEKRRCDAWVNADRATVADILGDEFIYVHADADYIDTKATSLELFSKHDYLRLTRRNLKVRLYGDVAVVTGPVYMREQHKTPLITPMGLDDYASEVFVKRSGRWQLVTYQSGAVLNEREAIALETSKSNIPSPPPSPPALPAATGKAEAEILAFVERERQAWLAGDTATLGQLLADDIVHVSVTGDIEDKAALLTQPKVRLLKLEQGPFKVRFYGDLAVLTGPVYMQYRRLQGSTVGPVDWQTFVTEVALKRHGQWRVIAYQATASEKPKLTP